MGLHQSSFVIHIQVSGQNLTACSVVFAAVVKSLGSLRSWKRVLGLASGQGLTLVEVRVDSEAGAAIHGSTTDKILHCSGR